jgi:hypothetical protein
MLEAGRLSGVDFKPFHDLMDYRIWEQELCDPETVKAGSLCFPIGAWATGQEKKQPVGCPI